MNMNEEVYYFISLSTSFFQLSSDDFKKLMLELGFIRDNHRDEQLLLTIEKLLRMTSKEKDLAGLTLLTFLLVIKFKFNPKVI